MPRFIVDHVPIAPVRVLAVLVCASSLLLGACAPGECSEAKPLVGELRGALQGPVEAGKLLPVVEKLEAVLAGASDPELGILGAHSRRLVKALKASGVAPTSEAELAARDRSANELREAIKAWLEGAERVSARVCT